ncbi:hypothetical protein CHS0354_024996 [Potamilus streckersoni]|uniref:Uncharacterized protein n=1 Tax=Potamilus streckersoni TaxID=2493646 RepID=A0AAE0T3G5_9BIVA|nr:hypothetical protein CHS0354_024996 [Potamilus streckersoni]
MENVSETNLKEEFISLLECFTGQGKPNSLRPIDVTLPRNVTDFEDRRAQGEERSSVVKEQPGWCDISVVIQ